MIDLNLTLNLDERAAWALAQFVKRVGWSELRENAISEDEAYEMRDGIAALQRALAEAGYAPR